VERLEIIGVGAQGAISHGDRPESTQIGRRAALAPISEADIGPEGLLRLSVISKIYWARSMPEPEPGQRGECHDEAHASGNDIGYGQPED